MNLFERKDCSPVVYGLAAYAAFQQQASTWDPLILRDAFQKQFNCKLKQKAFDKLMAGTSMIGTNLFTSSIQSFLACAAMCNNQRVEAQKLPFVGLKECCWAVFAYNDMLGITPQDQDPDDVFSPDIVFYIQQLMEMQGISQLPSYMQFANLPESRMTAIQQALIGDITAFQAYTARQLNQVQDINNYVKQQQKKLVQQLTQLDPIIHGNSLKKS